MTVGIQGVHVIADFYNCEADLDNLELIKNICIEAVRVSKATIIGDNFHKFEPLGVTGILLLQESHLSIHTWPEENEKFAAIDFYTCGNCDPQQGIEYLKKALKAEEANIQVINRGKKEQDQ